jgi:sulfide:quinone oxidoreductase
MADNGIQPARIVIAGGGVAALEATIALRALAGEVPAITMIAPNAEFVYQPLSVGEPFAMGSAPRLPLARFAEDLDVDWRQAGVSNVNTTRAVNLDDGSFVVYDRLIVAMGAPRAAVYEHATTFRGDDDAHSVHGLVKDLEMGLVKRVIFAVPAGVAWTLPIYELALMTARRAYEMQVDVELVVITPEDRPLNVFGAKAASEVEQRLVDAGLRLITSATAEIPSRGHVVVQPSGETLEAERVIALPISQGPQLPGLPMDSGGFIPIDSHARVVDMADVYAAGDGTNFPLKQGGIACQQADAAAEHIAASLGAAIEPQPFRPVLRGQLLTGDKPVFMRHDVEGDGAAEENVGPHPLWWPATKVAGRYLAAYLAEQDPSHRGSESVAPGVRRRAFLTPAADGLDEVPLRGYEYSGRWGATGH